MNPFWILLIIIAGLGLLFLLVLWGCYLLTFRGWPEKPLKDGEYDLPPGKIYRPHHEKMKQWQDEARHIPCRECYIRSFDGLKLHARYYEYTPGAPIELMFHGYRGTAGRDLCGGIQRCFSLKKNVLLVDQRTSGESEGRTITFGVNESRDCLSWVEFLVDTFGPEVKIILTGISMGAATVLMAAARGLPSNVIGILADCGYTSARDIIRKVIRQLKLPVSVMYPLVKLSAKVFGRFDLEELSPMEAMKSCTIPVVFIHGEDDDFVPCDMSRQNYEACAAPKTIFTVPGAGHGLAYVIDPEGYLNTLNEFAPEWGL